MKSRDLFQFKASTFALAFVVLFHASFFRFFDLKSSVADAARATSSWSTWGSWSVCDAFHLGRQTRSRKCVGSNGRTVSSSYCVGLSQRTRPCEPCAYPLLNVDRTLHPSSKVSVSKPIFSSSSFNLMHSKTAWCSSSSKSFTSDTEYLEIAFKNFVRFTAITTRGYRGAKSGFVKEFKLKYSYNGMEWFPYTNNVGETIFKGNRDPTRPRQNKLDRALVARYLRVYPTSYHSRPCLDVELYGCEYNCGGLITDESVRVKAPNAAPEIDEPNCLWRIESRVATKLQLKFPLLNLLCRDGVMKIFDGSSPFLEADLVEAFCGTSRKISPIMFHGSDLWVHYRTNATTDDVGFEMQANIFAMTTLNSTNGEIIVPETSEGYAHVYRCLWTIASQEPNTTIQLTIHHFASENDRLVDGKCVGDMLVISEGVSPISLLGRYCDGNHPKDVVSKSGSLRLKFRARSENPSWKLHFSYKILDGKSKQTLRPPTTTERTVFNRQPRDTVPAEIPVSRPKINTKLDALQRNTTTGDGGNVPVIVSSVLAVVIVVVLLVALAHYLRRRNQFMKKHPYDCSNRPMSHFGDEDSTPFLNTNVLMWSDSSSRNSDKEKPRNGKNSLPFVTVALREDGPQRLSFIPPEMISAQSEQSLENVVNKDDPTGSLIVSDAFTEECIQLLNNNLNSTLQKSGSQESEEESETETQREDQDGTDKHERLPEIASTSSETQKEDNESSRVTDEENGYELLKVSE